MVGLFNKALCQIILSNYSILLIILIYKFDRNDVYCDYIV